MTTSDGERRLRALHAVILATGSTAALPDIPGLVNARPWTNREATSVSVAPAELIVLGSGAVGLELAQAWRDLGTAEVIVLSRSEALLPNHEPFAGELVLEGLRQAGVEVRFGAQVSGVERLAGGGVTVTLTDGSIERADELLVAVGKIPATFDVGIDTVGLTPGKFVDVGNDMRVAETDWLYAIGDVNGRALLSHEASHHARVAASSIVSHARGEDSDLTDEVNETAVPQVVFTDPEVASVGLTLAQAESRGIRARKIEADLGAVLGAQLHAKDYRGRVSFTVDDDRDVLIGATFVGQDVADMVHAATIAIVGQLTVRQLRHAVPSFPTMSEVWLELS